MTTAIDDLIQYVKDRFDMSQDGPVDLVNHLKHLKEKEKEQMFACFRNGFIEGMSQHAGLPRRYKEFEDYYNTIFNNNATEGE